MTPIPRRLLGALIVPPSGRVMTAVTFDAWLAAKDVQRREDGTTARVSSAHLDILLTLPSHHRPAPVNEIDAARIAALPRIRHAVAARRAAMNGGAE